MLSAPPIYQLGILWLYDLVLRQKFDQLVAFNIPEGDMFQLQRGESCSGLVIISACIYSISLAVKLGLAKTCRIFG